MSLALVMTIVSVVCQHSPHSSLMPGLNICDFTLLQAFANCYIVYIFYKQVIEYFNFYNNPVYLCYLDASKALDKMNHWHLFYKLLDKNVPRIIVHLLIT